MNLDQASLGSPVAKRRSLHGSASFGHDFNVFDHGPASSPQFDIHDDSNHEYELSAASLAPENASLTSMPRRSSSLRKSTLQQRHGEKTSWGRRHAAQVLAAQQLAAQNGSEVSTPNPVKNRPRLSLDQFMPPMARESPFTSQGSLPHPSMHVVNQPAHQPHPLSRTMTTSSSNSSLVDESPTHVPVHFGEHPRPKLDFSKSLPVGSLNPFAPRAPQAEEPGSFSTPQNYKSVKPLPAAFMSTGLVSKVNRNPEDEPPRGLGKGVVPDTPCKKQVNIFATYPPNLPGSAAAKGRHIRPSFGNPSTPFNPHGIQGNSSIFGKGSGVFGGAYSRNGISRRGSFLSNDGDETGNSPDTKGDDRTSSDFDFPPTPTKQAIIPGLTPRRGDGSPSSHRSISVSTSASGYGLAKKLVRTRSKLNLSTTPVEKEADHSYNEMGMDDSPTPADSKCDAKLSMPMPLSSISLPTQNSTPIHSPTPLMRKSLTVSFLAPSRPGFAKISHVVPASSLERIGFVERLSPSTPKDGLIPPDPSGLSISNPKNGQIQKSGRVGSASMFPPATPTTGREPFMADRRLSMTPLGNLSAATEMDKALTSRFEKAELIGTGEFSHVYRVTQPAPRMLRASQSVYFGASGSPFQGRSPQTPMPERVFAVKKSRQPYQGTRDRERKLQEVSVLKALGQSDHVVHLIDSWEDNSYLYIQTEFCEEGGLDMFLSQVGRKGRLDDFRIWKIVLELGLVSGLHCANHLSESTIANGNLGLATHS